jgi:quinol monooxygenase YgiN
VSYQVDPEDRDAFLRAIYLLRAARQRDGAVSWGVYEDTERQGVFIEHFVENDWAEHLRHHERVTRADMPLQQAVQAFHRGDGEPEVRHFLAVRPTRRYR